MTPEALILRCADAGVSVHLEGGSVRMRGARDAVHALLDVMRENRSAVIAHLANSETPDLVTEFMEVDGLTREEAMAMAAISVRPRSADDWVAMLLELDQAIREYFERFVIPDDIRGRVLGARANQSLASAVATLAWFKCELQSSVTGTRERAAHHDD